MTGFADNAVTFLDGLFPFRQECNCQFNGDKKTLVDYGACVVGA